MAVRSVRDATFDVFREYGLPSLFANPGATEISLLADLPDDLRFVLGLHESSVVGMATGWAIGRGEPALAVLHTTPGLGSAGGGGGRGRGRAAGGGGGAGAADGHAVAELAELIAGAERPALVVGAGADD